MTRGRARLALALGNPHRELVFLPAVEEWDEFTVEVCVHAADLLARAQAGALDAVLVSSELPGFGREQAAELARTQVGAATVLLVEPDATPPWAILGLPLTLPLDATPAAVRVALAQLQRGSAARVARADGAAIAPSRPQVAVAEAPAPMAVLAVASGVGSPGRTTVALSLAAALGAVAPTVLVDADLAGPSVAPRLDLNPRRNLFQVAYAQPAMPAAWDEQLARALQPLGRTSPHGQALCGLATSAMRSQVSPGFFTDLLDVLRARYRYVVLDLGADLLGTDAALHRTALHLADQVLLVTTPDIVDLLRVQAALGALATLGCDERRIALIANQYDRRRHPRRTELEWGLDRAVAALVPYDHAGLARAQAACQPVVLATRSRAGRALLDLAGRVYGGRLELPAERPRQGRWRLPLRLRWGNARLALRPRSAPLTLAEPAGEAGGSGDGH